MKYTLYGTKLRYRGFKLDISIIAVCSLMGAAMLMALLFSEMADLFLWSILALGNILNILLMTKCISRRYFGRAIMCGVVVLLLLTATIFKGIDLII